MVVYALILALPYTKWRDRLPAKPSFYRYIIVLFGMNSLAALGALLACMQEHSKACSNSLRRAAHTPAVAHAYSIASRF